MVVSAVIMSSQIGMLLWPTKQNWVEMCIYGFEYMTRLVRPLNLEDQKPVSPFNLVQLFL